MFKIKFHEKDDAMGHYCEVLEKSLKKKARIDCPDYSKS